MRNFIQEAGNEDVFLILPGTAKICATRRDAPALDERLQRKQAKKMETESDGLFIYIYIYVCIYIYTHVFTIHMCFIIFLFISMKSVVFLYAENRYHKVLGSGADSEAS